MKKGYLTVYLSLTLAVLMSFVLTLVEGARISATRMRAACVADIGINSTLSEYNRELLEQYDLLFVDMTYGGSGGIDNVRSHLENYLKKNLDDATPALSRDLLGMKLDDVTIEEYALATDNDAEAVKRQVADYMQTTVKGIALSGVDDLTDDLSGSGYDYNVAAERNAAKSEIRSALVGEEENDDPGEVVEAVRGGGILGTVLRDTSGISTVRINPESYVSNRQIMTGNGISDEERSLGRSAGKITYTQYLYDKCGYYMHPKDGSVLKYEIEYIIKHKDNDWDNLEAVSRTLAAWREGTDFAYLLTDSARRSEVEVLAEGLAIVLQNPELKDAIMISIMAAWAYVEALQDVKILLEGDGVPVAKTSETWHTKLSDIFNPRAALRSYPGQQGAKYSDYLYTMLLMTGYSSVVAKSMDIMEMDVRKAAGNNSFKMDYCMQSFLVDIRTASTHGHNCELRRRSGYYYS